MFNATEVNTKDSFMARIRRVCRSPQGVACLKRSTQELGRPCILLRTLWNPVISHERETRIQSRYWTPTVGYQVCQTMDRKGWQTGCRESDSLIVLRDGKADHMGKGWAVWRKTHRKLLPDMQGRSPEANLTESLTQNWNVCVCIFRVRMRVILRSFVR